MSNKACRRLAALFPKVAASSTHKRSLLDKLHRVRQRSDGSSTRTLDGLGAALDKPRPPAASAGGLLWGGSKVHLVTMRTGGPPVISLVRPRKECPISNVKNLGHNAAWAGYRTKPKLAVPYLENYIAHANTEDVIVLMDSDIIYAGCEVDDFFARYRTIVRASGRP